MWRVLRELGFSYKKRDNKRYVYEQRNRLEQRYTYLQTIPKLRQDNTHPGAKVRVIACGRAKIRRDCA